MDKKRLIVTGVVGGEASAPVLPYSIDFSALADGALPSSWLADTWAIASGKALNSPTFGAEKIANPGFEGTYTSGLAPNWNKFPAGAIVAESGDVHGGSAAQSVSNPAGNQGQIYSPNFSLTAGDWVLFKLWSKAAAGTGSMNIAQVGGASLSSIVNPISGATYAERAVSQIILSTQNHNLKFQAKLDAVAETNTIIGDDASFKTAVSSTLLATLDVPYSGVLVVKASLTFEYGYVNGVVGWWDKDTAFQNCIVAYHDGSKAYLCKFVGSTFTSLLAVTTTYAAGADIEIRRLTGTNTFQLWYNGSQVGTDQDITDVEIINNTYFNILSIGGGSGCDAFFLS